MDQDTPKIQVKAFDATAFAQWVKENPSAMAQAMLDAIAHADDEAPALVQELYWRLQQSGMNETE